MFKNKLFINFSATKRFEECDYYFKSVIRNAISSTLEYERFAHDAEISVTLCDNEYIRSLNNQYRGKDSATDVLSFPLYDLQTEADLIEDFDSVPLGDVVISIERAKEQAKEIGHGFLDEIAFLTIHSVLHLLGYDHERSKADDEKQCEHQRAIVAMLDI
jgi:probable rRNA maturation factor